MPCFVAENETDRHPGGVVLRQPRPIGRMRADGPDRWNERRITQEILMTTDQRLARLEKQCSLLKAGFALVTVALAVVLLIGAGQDQVKPKVLEEVRAKRFVMVDKDGKPRGELGVFKDVPNLVLADENGKYRVGLGVSKDGPGLSFRDKEGEQRLTLGLSDGLGGPSLALSDRAGLHRAVLGCDVAVNETTDVEHKYPESTLTLYDASGKVIFQAPK